MTTTQTPAPAQPVTTCPPSDVHDMIVRWFEVDAGELVLYNGKLRSLEAMWPVRAPFVGVRLLHGGVTADFWVDSNDLTAVRRYTEGLLTIPATLAQTAAAGLDEAADDRDERAHHARNDELDNQAERHTQRAGEYRQARDELLEACRG